jgi:KRAB domain-containing zinc finger protein
MSNFQCSLCDFLAQSEEILNHHIMDCHSDIILKKEVDTARENMECLVEIKTEVEDPLSADNSMDVDDNEDGEGSSSAFQTENSDPSRIKKQPDKNQLHKLKKTRLSSRQAAAPQLKKKRSELMLHETKYSAANVRKPSKMFQCKSCNFKGANRMSLQYHTKSVHSKELKFLCTACGKRFMDQQELSNHIEKNNITTSDGVWQMACSKYRKVPSKATEYLFADDETQEVKCLRCDYSSDTPKAAKRHVERIHLKLFNRFICNACSQSFSSKEVLAIHLKEDHRDFSLVEKFSIPEEATQADLEERPESPTFECKDCAYTTKFRGSLYRHVTSAHSKETRFSCEDCGSHYAEHFELVRHVEINSYVKEDGSTGMKALKKNDYSEMGSDEDPSFSNDTGEIVIQCCHLCKFKSDSQRNLARHIRTVHGEKKFSCTNCEKKFASKRVLNQHIARSCKVLKQKQKFQKTPANPADSVEKDEESGEFKCSLCPFTSTEDSNVINHIEKIHVKLVCNICSAEFSPDDDLSEHNCGNKGDAASGTDGASKIYNCDECDYTSTFRNNVAKHMRSIHQKEKKYLCSDCGSQFNEQKSLNYHLEKNKIVHSDGSVEFSCAKFTKLPSRAGEHVHKDEISNIFLCKICDYNSQSQTDTKRHIQRVHLGEKRFICNTCNMGFMSQPEVGRHLAKDHNDTSLLEDPDDLAETYKCQQCSYESSSRINVDRHFSVVHMKERNYQCTECGQRYSDKKTLLMHVEKNQVTMPDGKTVLQCTKFTKLPSRAGEHLRKDEDSNLFHCNLCNYSSKNQSGAKRHVERMHLKEKRFVCNTCNQDFSNKRELAYHLGTEHNDLSLCENGGSLHSLKPEALQCEYCEYSSTVRQYLERHVKAVHLRERNFVCSECGFAFSEKKSLQGHLDRNTITTSNGVAILQCSKFRKLSSSAGEHVAKNKDTNEFYCLQCSYRSKCPSDTKRHVERMHLKLKKFICKLCDKGFSSKPNFYLHLATDHGDNSLIAQRPNIAKRLELHHCQYCSYTTKYPKDLQRHFNSIHNKERQSFFCDRCDKKFADKRGLMRHLRANH